MTVLTRRGKLRMTFSLDAREWLARSIGTTTRYLDIGPMKGSTSSSVFLVQCSRSTTPQRFVLRVLDNHEWLAEEPDLAAHEAAALEEAQKAGLRAPSLVAYSSDDIGFGAPVVLMSFIEGNIELWPSNFQGWLAGLAGALAAIHRHPAHAFAWRYRSWVEKATLAPPAWSTIPGAWERAIELVRSAEPDAHVVFIHRDYHPTNVLWHQGVVSGVIDWINACQGPAGVDVAHCRTNLAQMFGPAAADQFLETYIKVAEGFAYDPDWDLDSVLDMCIPQPTFYPPWQDFGLSSLTPEVLKQRVDAYLERVLMRT
jgi:aminoglycoside phosphotransferase (APT) family kinase protein